MKQLLLAVFSLFIYTGVFAQEGLSGIWEGKIEAGVTLRIVFHFSYDEKGKLITTLDSPDQGATGIPTDTSYQRNDSIFTTIEKLKVEFSGRKLNDTVISGVFRQVIPIPLVLKKVNKLSTVSRQQTPVPPFPYVSEEVTYYNADKSIQYGATITYPQIEPGVNYIKAPVYPVVMLITGSGPQNRDEEILNHKPFAVIADYLTRNGFIVLRVDDRGVGKTTGEFTTATSADFANDVMAGLDFIKKHVHADTNRMGLIGHSEGGIIAPMVANKRNDIRFIVLLAGPGIRLTDLMTEQNVAILRSTGTDSSAAEEYGKLYHRLITSFAGTTDTTVAMKKGMKIVNTWVKGKDKELLDKLQLSSEENRKSYIKSMAITLTTPWFHYFINYDPSKELRKLKNIDVLALNGDKDLQVPASSNLYGMEKSLMKSKARSFRVMVLPGLNHLFQTCRKCTLMEYGQLEETFSPVVLKLIGSWLHEVVLKN